MHMNISLLDGRSTIRSLKLFPYADSQGSLIRATAQLAGAGLLRGDLCRHLCLMTRSACLQGVRNCWFKQPVLLDTDVAFHLRADRWRFVGAGQRTCLGGRQAGQFEVLIVYAPRERLFTPPVTG